MTLDELTVFVEITRETLIKAQTARTHHRFTILELAKAVHIIALHLHEQKAAQEPPRQDWQGF